MTDQIAVMVHEFNSIEQQLVPLQDSENQLRNLDSQVAATSSEINRRQSLLNKANQDDAYLQKRIHRNENPRFLHYFVCNRGAKVDRLKGELQQLNVMEQDLANKLSADSTQLANVQQQRQSVHAVVDRKHQLEGQSRNLFNQVVDAQPPTPSLQQLQAGVQQQRALMASEQALLQRVGNSVQQVQQGLSIFQRAEGIYRQAHQINERAKDCVRREQYEERREFRDEVVGNDFGAENAEWNRQRLERQERDLQCQRDNLINQAHEVAMSGYQILSAAFANFPPEARARYPQLCTSIGQVAFPRVHGANFGSALMSDMIFGTFGAAMNDMSSGCQIQDNMRVMEQCISMTSQQLGQVTAVQSAVNSNVHQIQSSIGTLEQNILAERNKIFNHVRAAVMASAAPAGA